MKSWYAYHALMNLDNNCEQYIQKYANSVVSTNIMKTSELSETKLKGGKMTEAEKAAQK
mgnify:CR=1 FL=1